MQVDRSSAIEAYNVTWEEEDLRAFTSGPMLREDGSDPASYKLLMAVAERNALYYSDMAHHQWASDDDTDYINSHSECMLAANALWYDGDPTQMLDWLSVWANNLWLTDDYIEETDAIIKAFREQDVPKMIKFIVASIES